MTNYMKNNNKNPELENDKGWTDMQNTTKPDPELNKNENRSKILQELKRKQQRTKIKTESNKNER